MLGLVILTDWLGWSNYIGVGSVGVFIFGFCMGNGPVTWIYMADILPDVGISLVVTVLWIFTAGVGLGFPAMKDTWSIVTAFDVFLVASILGLLFDIFLMTETKGKTQK